MRKGVCTRHRVLPALFLRVKLEDFRAHDSREQPPIHLSRACLGTSACTSQATHHQTEVLGATSPTYPPNPGPVQLRQVHRWVAHYAIVSFAADDRLVQRSRWSGSSINQQWAPGKGLRGCHNDECCMIGTGRVRIDTRCPTDGHGNGCGEALPGAPLLLVDGPAGGSAGRRVAAAVAVAVAVAVP
jgi:hypothetical protein